MPTLTEAQIRAAKPREKPYKVYDARGLYLPVKPNDGRFWRFKYRFGGKEKLLSFGTYPYVSLKRQAEWAEFDFNAAEWRVPAHRMKMKEQHVVPLARQSIEILRELQPLTARGRLVFPSLRSADRPLSENAITAALRRMGYTVDEMTWHGFRTVASTCLNELGWNPDLIELQLAHAERNEVRGAYNRAQRMAERRQMMQAWADYLDGLRNNTAK